ncbi:MAG: hypothetical protein KGL46_05610 [Hyphomicrobiales bacterium]|nr:hypothetical protein [Hyphomicrobiales bacterium]
MTDLQSVIVALAISYALLGALLLALLIYARLDWRVKAGAVVLTSAFYIVGFFASRNLVGWPAQERLPPYFKLLQARIVEPHMREDDPGSIYLWVEALDETNRPVAAPRAYRLPYNAHLAEKTEKAISASADGRPQGGRAADFGSGEGGVAQEAQRLVTPSSITTTGGGDPSGGGPLDPAFMHGEDQTIVFAPLPPPRMPKKDD